ncbi:hypothetical protein BDA99DRAFT_538748 [Phascolomyces articulosus]|uniref:Kelch repeat protein n=1 Tax=Phascolomyces articulosus TaxID=60185 RepID=A0AAD5K6R8_9FUNG|nr:hypothetical protein BDA99DRAFT_538748 [Phascolomyces articulosus]
MYIQQYDFSTSEWKPLPAVAEGANGTTLPGRPRNRVGASATAIGEYIYLSGGVPGDMNGTVEYVLVWMYNPANGLLTPMTQRNETITTRIAGSSMYTFLLEYSSVYIFDTVRNVAEQKIDIEGCSLCNECIHSDTSGFNSTLLTFTTFPGNCDLL